MTEPVKAYMDLPLGFVDAATMPIADGLQLTAIAPLDPRHFAVVRPGHARVLTLLPGADA